MRSLFSKEPRITNLARNIRRSQKTTMLNEPADHDSQLDAIDRRNMETDDMLDEMEDESAQEHLWPEDDEG